MGGGGLRSTKAPDPPVLHSLTINQSELHYCTLYFGKLSSQTGQGKELSKVQVGRGVAGTTAICKSLKICSTNCVTNI